jgi:hypothetical protein
MANPNVEYLGVMAWAAQFQWIPDRTAPGDRLEIFCSASKAKVGEEVRPFRKKLGCLCLKSIDIFVFTTG